MVMRVRLWCAGLLVCLLGLSAASHARADQLAALSTQPEALANLSQAELNALGLKFANEAYSIMAQAGNPATRSPKTIANAKALFDRDALIQNARLNYGLTKAAFKPTEIGAFSVSNVVLNRAAPDVLVTSFDVQMPNRTALGESIAMSGERRPRLVILRWNKQQKRWLVISSADFDTPKGTVCGSPISSAERKSRFKSADIALAKANLDRFLDSSLTGQEKAYQAKGFTYVFADGQRKTQDSGVRTRIHKKPDLYNVEAIRSGNLLTVRFDLEPAASLDGAALHDALRPRLMTMIKGDDGQWRMLAIGLFSVTADLAKQTQCVKASAR